MSYRIDNRYYPIDPRYNSGYEDGRKASKGKIKDLELANAEYRDTIAQQAERIKELEAAIPLYDELLIRCAIAEKELANLRKRIDDAKVVQKSKRQLLSRVEELSLIVKEDLL